MEIYENQTYTGERALFKANNKHIRNCVFKEGESPLKESQTLNIELTSFEWKYPLWYTKNVVANNITITNTGRSGIWYTKDITINDSTINAPKNFRKSSNVYLNNVKLNNALETFWNCNDIKLSNVYAKGDYFGFNTVNIEVDNFVLDGNYGFDGCKNITVKNSKITSKDAFWNCENVIVYDSEINGEYLGWNSKNLKFVNCTITSEQGMCYIDNLILENCKIIDSELIFEYTTLNAETTGDITSIKNPISGIIKAESIKEIIFDDPEIIKENTTITITNEV